MNKFLCLVSIGVSLLQGCGSGSSNSPAAPAPVNLAMHVASECPEGIDGSYACTTTGGTNVTITLNHAPSEVMQLTWTVAGDEENALTVPVDGESHKYDDKGTYISLGCQKSKLISVSAFEGVSHRGEYEFKDGDLNVKLEEPKQTITRCKKIEN